MQLHAGGVLYQDVLWVFPPLHVLPAWIAYGLDPPGFVVARAIYAFFNVALVIAMYALGLRLMPRSFAFLGALLLAVAAPRTHLMHALFGYRYLVFPVLALLAFDRRLRTDRSGWMMVAGAWAGLALAFRLTPAFALSVGIGVAVMASQRSWRGWLVDWGLYAAGLAAVMTPVLAWLAWTVGLERVFQEVVLHPLAMLQSRPPPSIDPIDWANRQSIYRWFVAVEFRAYWLLYGGYAAALGGLWLFSVARRRTFRHSLLLAVVILGGVYFVRSLGRSDEPHLDSVLPPICLLLAHLVSRGFAAVWPAGSQPTSRRSLVVGVVGAALLFAWIFFNGSDRYLDRRWRGIHRVSSLEGVRVTGRARAAIFDRVVSLVNDATEPDDVILIMTNAPMFHLLTGRTGPGYRDILMPGTFMSEEEEEAFVARMKASPPAAVIFPERPFDLMPSRAVQKTAPRLSRWVFENYESPAPQRQWIVLFPSGSPELAEDDP
jgi:hypothetical protein